MLAFLRRRGRALGLGTVLVAAAVPVSIYSLAMVERSALAATLPAKTTPDALVEAYARHAAATWDNFEPRDVWNKLRKFPPPFRPAKTAVSFLSNGGLCSEFVFAARFMLGGDFKVIRHDLVFRNAGHSAVTVLLPDGRPVFIDPFLGVIFKDGDRLLSLSQVREKLSAGTQINDLLVEIGPRPQAHQYSDFAGMLDAYAGTPLAIDLQLPAPINGAPLEIGTVDGSEVDVTRRGVDLQLTSHFFYVGKRFPAEFNFRYDLSSQSQEHAHELRITLTKVPELAQLPKFSVSPRVEGADLVFELPAGTRALTTNVSHLSHGDWYAIDKFKLTRKGAALEG